MYEHYWHLDSNPFQNAPQVAFYHDSPTHQAALLKLRYAVENRKGAALLSGPVGSGKTLLVNVLAEQLSKEVSPQARVVFPQMPTAELLSYLACELGAWDRSEPTGELADTLRRLRRFLEENAAKGNHALVVIDEAHLIDDPRLFEALRLLMNFQHEGRYTFTLLLVGQPHLLTNLSRMGSFEERIAVKALLRPLSADETTAYINRRLEAAGAAHPLFAPEALMVIHELSAGIPASINRLCDLALLVGYAEQADSVAAAHVETVADDVVALMPE